MNRVLVIGSGGAGKSTFAARLAQITGIPAVHLDSHYWNSGWIQTPAEEWPHRVAELLLQKRWIIDGNYRGTLDQRLAACDTVVFLDLPRLLCFWRVIKRRLRYHGRSRPDMPDGCPEQICWEFARWIWDYPVKEKPKMMEKLASVGRDKRVLVLRSAREVEEFFSRISAGSVTNELASVK
jgi:adenylate kinase family enzyme